MSQKWHRQHATDVSQGQLKQPLIFTLIFFVKVKWQFAQNYGAVRHGEK